MVCETKTIMIILIPRSVLTERNKLLINHEWAVGTQTTG